MGNNAGQEAGVQEVGKASRFAPEFGHFEGKTHATHLQALRHVHAAG
jgi:hypothetical protein